eukprot:scaffold2364_cov74-Cylindrotheca_fusiformis.AAC.1
MEETEPEQSNKQPPTTLEPEPTPTYANQHHQYIQQEEEEQKFTAFANRDNSDYKWKRARNVLGVLEIASEPILKPRDEFQPRPATKGRGEMIFQQALDIWEQERLRSELIVVLESLPVETCCCGLFRDHESTKKDFVKLLNDKWAKTANKKLSRHGFKIDFFLWNWQNASGKAETNIILIRFFILSSYGLRAAAAAAAGDAIGAGGGFHFSDELSESYRIPAPAPQTPTASAPTATTAPAPTVTAPAPAATTNTNIDHHDDYDEDEQIIEA